MGGNHPKNIDLRPKRRKDKDNPYEIFTTGLGTAQPHYYLAFVDSTGAEQCTLIVPVVEVREYHGAYIYGYPDGTFGPERNMTRSEAAAIFARLLSEAKGEHIPAAGQTKFKDVPADAWYSGEVKYLTNYGVVFGTTKTTFSPNDEISRAEFVTMAVRFFEVCGGGNAEIKEQYTKFSDVSSGYWAAEYIMDAAMCGWIHGYRDREPKDKTRGKPEL